MTKRHTAANKPHQIIPPITDAQEAAAQRSIVADPDNPEWTDAELASARPFADVFPELAKKMRRGRSA